MARQATNLKAIREGVDYRPVGNLELTDVTNVATDKDTTPPSPLNQDTHLVSRKIAMSASHSWARLALTLVTPSPTPRVSLTV